MPRGSRGGPSDWRLQAIPKPRKDLDELLHWPPLCQCCALFNLYGRLLWTAVPHAMSPLLPVHFGFAKGAQAMDAIEFLRTLVRKAHEWDHPPFIASLDVDKAFDQIEVTWWKRLCSRTWLLHGPLQLCSGNSWLNEPCIGWLVLRRSDRWKWVKVPGRGRRGPPIP